MTTAPPRRAAPAKDMIWVRGGGFEMGSDAFYPEERPVHRVDVDGFWMDEHQVTVAEFRKFVKATGHVTGAERAPAAEDYPHADPELLVPGSLVFHPTRGAVDLSDYRNWWSWTPGADWRHPDGPDSTLHGRERHPVTQVAYDDAVAYARWAGKELPNEAEWEFAARGGLEGAVFTWGDEFAPKGKMMANTWQGEFPWQNLAIDGYEGTSPVKSFPPNGYGLYDMAGNVWEWTSDLFTPSHGSKMEHACCVPRDPRTDEVDSGFASDERFARHVIKGGSHLCAPNYCLRYRPAARQAETIDTSTAHIGFRCIVRTT
jgi:sulfatase modifying factor 1